MSRKNSVETHYCHAEGCKILVPPRLFMCKFHWYQVPKKLRDRIWEEYRPGQEIDKNPSKKYLKVAAEAIDAVAIKEGLR